MGPRVSALLQRRLRRAREASGTDDSSDDSEPSFEGWGTARARAAAPRDSSETSPRGTELAEVTAIEKKWLTHGPTSEPIAMQPPRARASDVHPRMARSSVGHRMSLSHEPRGSLTPTPSPLLSQGPFARDARDARSAHPINGNHRQSTMSQNAAAGISLQLASTALPNLTSQIGRESAPRFSAAASLPWPNEMQSHTSHRGQEATKPAHAPPPNRSDKKEAQAWGDAWPSKLHGDSQLRRTCSIA